MRQSRVVLSVCVQGEDKWIFPYQENADVMFNSALLFEFAVLRLHAEPILMGVPRNCPGMRGLSVIEVYQIFRSRTG